MRALAKLPTDYITRAELKEEFVIQLANLEKQLMVKIKALMEEQRREFERNVGVIAEHFLEKVQLLAEGIQMQIESNERYRRENELEHEKFELRVSYVESKVIFTKVKKLKPKRT